MEFPNDSASGGTRSSLNNGGAETEARIVGGGSRWQVFRSNKEHNARLLNRFSQPISQWDIRLATEWKSRREEE